MSRIGLHVSAAGGLDRAPANAKAMGCEVFQFFSRSPRGGSAKPISPSLAASFRRACAAEKFESYIHAPYYINFASSNNRISWGSVAAIREELTRGSLLGVKHVMTHLGSRRDLGEMVAAKQVIERVKAVFEKGHRWTTTLLLENSAGATGVIGDIFEELGAVWKGVGRADIGICLDTCHLFASGYDIRSPQGIRETMTAYVKHLPLSTFKLVHANDSKAGLGERKDRHEHIGDGQLGAETFRALLSDRAWKTRNFILETPGEEPSRKRDVARLKELRDS